MGESHHSSRPQYIRDYKEREAYKGVKIDRSPKPTQRTSIVKRSLFINLGPFTRWIQEVAPKTSLKLPQFVLYNGHLRPLEHICKYISLSWDLVTNDEEVLCKVFHSILSNKALT